MSRRAITMCVVAGVFFGADLITYHYAINAMGAGWAR